MKGSHLAKLAGNRIGRIKQPPHQTFDEPLRHRLAWVLARDDPDGPHALADHEFVEVATLQAAPQPALTSAACHAVCQQRKMPVP